MNYRVENLADLATVAESILAAAPCRFFTLRGEMGAGKTTLVAEFARLLGAIDAIASPTFPIVNVYNCENGSRIFHLDLYRLKEQQEAIDLGIEDIIYEPKSYIFVEWHDLIADLLPDEVAHIIIERVEGSESKRIVTLDLPH